LAQETLNDLLKRHYSEFTMPFPVPTVLHQHHIPPAAAVIAHPAEASWREVVITKSRHPLTLSLWEWPHISPFYPLEP
jgi:hypothetical protein